MGAYDRLVDYFVKKNDGDDGADRNYQVLVFRGMGESTQGSFSRMTTSGLAKDALAVLDHAGWTKERDVHLIGTSMGGMIALELADLASNRFKSLSLIVTGATARSPKNNRFVLLSALGGKTIDDRINKMMSVVLSDEAFLDMNDVKDERFPNCKTNRELCFETLKWRATVTKQPTLSTFIGQFLACFTHRVSAERLAKIGSSIPDMIAIGALADKLVDPELSVEIAKHSGCKLSLYPGKGHLVVTEAESQVLAELDQVIENGQTRYALEDIIV